MWLVSQQIYQMGIEQGEAKMQERKEQEIKKLIADQDQEIQKIKADMRRQLRIFALDRTGKYSLDEIAARAGTTVDEVKRVLDEADAFEQSVAG